MLRAGGGITTILPNLWFDNFLTGGFPFIVNPTLTALPGAPVPFDNAVTTLQLPPVYTTSGQLAFPTGRTSDVAPNTQLDVPRFQADLSALTPGHQPQPLSVYGMTPNFRNGYIGNYTAGIEQTFKDVVLSASYVATVGVNLASTLSPNGYTGASPAVRAFHPVQFLGPDHGRVRSGVPHGNAFPLHLSLPPGFRIQELSAPGIGFSIQLHLRQIARRYQRRRGGFRRTRGNRDPGTLSGPVESRR